MASTLIPTDQPPASFTKEQREWLNRMFKQARLSDQNSDILVPLTKVPDNPITNKLYWFANPIPASNIAYEGVYIYKSDGRWWALADLAVGAAWEDNTGQLEPGNSVGGAPTYMFPNGGNYQVPIMNGTPQRRWQIPFHVKHDASQGSVIFPHVHWLPDGTWGAGQTATFLLTWQAAAGHQQAAFSAPVSIVITHAPAAGPYPIWEHMIAEGTNPTTQGIPMPEVDSLILMTVELQSKTGGSPNVGGMFVDLHYQRERISTVDKAPDFYT